LAKTSNTNTERTIGMLAHTEIASTDPEATGRFVAKIFKWDLEEAKGPDGKLIRYRTPGGARGSIRATHPKEAPGTINYVLVDDIETAAKSIKRAGGEIVMPIVDVPDTGRFFWFKIPGGPVLAAWQDVPKKT
jgi:predicted enzyme related to lactoylglutathione lyase